MTHRFQRLLKVWRSALRPERMRAALRGKLKGDVSAEETQTLRATR